MTRTVWEKLNPRQWPFDFKALPEGSALVGGAIRDALLNTKPIKPDLDLVVPDAAFETARKLANTLGGKCILLDSERDIACLILNGWKFDFAKQVGNTLEEDLLRRDYRLNSIAFTLGKNPALFDPNNGINDLKERKLVAISEVNLVDDPLRLLRGYRLMSEHNLSIDEQTNYWILKHSSLLKKSAPERIQAELQKLVRGECADSVISLVRDTRILGLWEASDNSFHSTIFNVQTLNSIFSPNELSSALPLLRLTNLLSDKGLSLLRFSRRQQQRCKILRKWQKCNDGFAYKNLNESDLFQLHIDLEEDLPALIIGLSERDQRDWIARWRDRKDPLFHPSSPLDGHKLQISLGLSSGLELGRLIRFLSQERAFRRVLNEEDALEAAREWFKHN